MRGFREKILIQKVVRFTDDNGDVVNEWQDYYFPLAASVEEIRPSLDIIATQETGFMFIRIGMRYNPEVVINIGDRILWRGFTFNSIEPIKVDRVKRWMEVICKADIKDSDRENQTPIDGS